MKLFAVIPAYNEEKTLPEVIKQTIQYVDKIILVDDASTDGTKKLVFDNNVIVLRNRQNKGKGYSARKGCDYAIKKGATHIILLDADLQHDPQEIPLFIKEYERTKADIIYGVREFDKNMPLKFRIGNWGLTFGHWILFHEWVSDSQGGYRLLTAKAYKKIRWKTNGYFMETEMIARAGQQKLKYSTIKIKTIYHDKYKGTDVKDGIINAIESVKLKLKLLNE